MFFKKKKEIPIITIKSGNWEEYKANQKLANKTILYTGEMFLDVIQKRLYVGCGSNIISFQGIPTEAIDFRGRLNPNNFRG